MLSFLKIGQFLKIVGNGDSGSSKEVKESPSLISKRVSEPSTGSSSTLLKALPLNESTDNYLFHVQQVVKKKYTALDEVGKDGSKVASLDANVASIFMFLNIIRNSESSCSQSELSVTSPISPNFCEKNHVSPKVAGDEEQKQADRPISNSLDINALLKDRADMIDAIDVCLQEIPNIPKIDDDKTKSEDSAKGQDSGILSGVRNVVSGKEELSKSGDEPSSSAGVMDEAATLAVNLENDKDGEANAGASQDAHSFDLLSWRRLLLEVVEVLIAIDATLYFHLFQKGESQVLQFFTKTMMPRSENGLDSNRPSKTSSSGNSSTIVRKRKLEKEGVKDGTIGSYLSREETLEVRQNLDELLTSACSIATWVMLRSVLQHQIADLVSSGKKSSSTLGSRGSSEIPSLTEVSRISLNNSFSLIDWREVVSQLRNIFSHEHEYMVELVLCAAFLRDDGRELMYCFIQEPKAKEELQNALAYTYMTPEKAPSPTKSPDNLHSSGVGSSSIASSLHPSGLRGSSLIHASSQLGSGLHGAHQLRGTSIDDLNEEVENYYQRYIANSSSQYLGTMLRESPIEAKRANCSFSSVSSEKAETIQQQQTSSSSPKTFCQLATAYFFCSDEWTSEERNLRFMMLEEMDVRKVAEEKQQNAALRTLVLASASAGKKVNATETEEILENIPESDGGCAADVKISRATVKTAVLQELETRIINMSWTAALHKKVEHSIATRPPMLEVAKAYADKERLAASVFNDFRAKQRALSSLVNTYLAAGLSQEALTSSRRHFNNEKNEWASSNETLFSAVRYLQSMVQLVQAQAACQKHEEVLETVQIVLPQADLCEKMLRVLAPQPRDTFVLRFSDTRAKVLRSRIYLLKEGWRSLAFKKNDRDAKYFQDYIQVVRQLRSRYRETEMFEAYMERGRQLMQRKRYFDAEFLFMDAVLLASRAMAQKVRPTPSQEDEVNAPPLTNSSFHRDIHLKVAGSGNLTTQEEHITDDPNVAKKLEVMWRLAESERLLGSAYVFQAENEVNVPKRRIELNNAVTHAYAAQLTLHKWQMKGGTPKRMLTAVPCSLFVICKALLLLHQPKKAMLLLEPLIEEKPSSASLRPPMWGEILQPTSEPLTAEDIVLRMDVTSVTIDVYQLYTQCLVQFEPQRALRAAEQARHLLKEVDGWINKVADLIQQCELQEQCAVRNSDVVMPASEGVVEEASPSLASPPPKDGIQVALDSESERLRARRALWRGSWKICRAFRDVEIATGDAYAKLKRWDDALTTYETLLWILKHKGDPSSSFVNTEVLPLHYRTLAGSGPEEVPLTDERVYEPVYGLSLPWAELLYHPEHVKPVVHNAEDYDSDFTDEVGEIGQGENLDEVKEELADHLAATNLIYSSLARVYQCMGELQTSIRYLKRVLEYSNATNNKLLYYQSQLHLARLYTSINFQRGELNQDAWEKVSALAKEYEDPDVSRETMRNIITTQINAGKYFEVVTTAEELNTLTKFAEGDEAAAYRRFALEALASAHLELGHFDDCLAALDERETVQEKSDEWTGKLYEMRSKAHIEKGNSVEAIKVLLSWVQKAKQFKNFDEAGKANSCLANAYAADHNELKSQRCHNDCIEALSHISPLSADQKKLILSSARWLVHYFYLSNELVHVDPPVRPVSGSGNTSEPSTPCPAVSSESHPRTLTNNSSAPFSNKSGNLAVLLSEEERRREGLPSLLKGNIDLEESPNSLGKASSPLISRDDTLGPGDFDEEAGSSESGVSSSGKSRNHSTSSDNDQKLVLCLSDSSGKGLGIVSRCNQASGALQADKVRGSANALGELVSEEDHHPQREIEGADGDVSKAVSGKVKKPIKPVMVSTKRFQSAVEIMEWCSQLLMHPQRHTGHPMRYTPQDAVDMVLAAHPRCTFLFFFAEYTTATSGSYDVVVRPFKSSFFISSSIQVHDLNPFMASLSGASNAASPDLFDKELEEQLGYLYEDLWDPVARALKKAKSPIGEADCVFVVPDPSLYNVPFCALINKSPGERERGERRPLGVQATLVVSPTLSHLLERGMARDAIRRNLLRGDPQSRRAILFETPTGGDAEPVVLSVAKRTLFGWKSRGPPGAEPKAAPIPSNEPLKVFESQWNMVVSETKQRVVDMFRNEAVKIVVMASPVSGARMKVSDGTVSCEDIIYTPAPYSRTRKDPLYNARHIELAIVQNPQTQENTEDPVGLSIKLCLHAQCARVLRIETCASGDLGMEHRKLIASYIQNLEKVLRRGQDYPFALALRLTINNAWEAGLPASLWGSLTLIGAP